MSANRAKLTRPELALAKFLRSSGIKGFARNYRKVIGKPDMLFQRRKWQSLCMDVFGTTVKNATLGFPKHTRVFGEINSRKISYEIE